MTDGETYKVRECINCYFEREESNGFDIGNPTHFEQLVKYVYKYAGLISVVEDDLRMVTAMCLLGPDSVGIPPAKIRNDLLDIIRGITSEKRSCRNPYHITEFVIAYGCGKWRRINGESGEWDRQWGRAVYALTRIIEPALTEAKLWLRRYVVGFPSNIVSVKQKGTHPAHQKGTHPWFGLTR